MDFKLLLEDKALKPKEKTEALSKWIIENPKEVNDLIEFASAAKDSVKATCIESLEYVSKSNASLATKSWLKFVTQTLKDKAPRVKWESARVIGNIAHLFPKDLEEAVTYLLVNSEHDGTVVRWSTAYALGEIIKLKLPLNKELVSAVESICAREEKNSIQKIYLQALKKV